MKFTAYKMYDAPYQIVPAPRTRDWMDETGGFAYRCLPMAVANQMGWIVPTPYDFTVNWDGGNSQDSISVICDGIPGYIKSHFGFGILTFSIPYVFRTPLGYGLIVRGAPNHIIPGVHPLDGYVETDWSVSTFTMNWKITEKDRQIHVKQGTPICMLQPFDLGALCSFEPSIQPIESDADLQEAYREWAVSRNAFNARTDRTAQEWQKDYFNGMHIPKVSLPPFK